MRRIAQHRAHECRVGNRDRGTFEFLVVFKESRENNIFARRAWHEQSVVSGPVGAAASLADASTEVLQAGLIDDIAGR